MIVKNRKTALKARKSLKKLKNKAIKVIECGAFLSKGKKKVKSDKKCWKTVSKRINSKTCTLRKK